MPIERRGVELRQDEDAADVSVQAIADRHVDQPIFAADRDRRLRSMVRERKEARPLSSAENERQDFVAHGHEKSKWYTARRAGGAPYARRGNLHRARHEAVP